MKTESIKSYQKSPSFGAIRVPVCAYGEKINYSAVSTILKKYAPKTKIERGLIDNLEYDYIQINAKASKGKKIFGEILTLYPEAKSIDGRTIKKSLNQYDKFMKGLDEEKVHVFTSDNETSLAARNWIRNDIYETLLSKTNTDYNGSLGLEANTNAMHRAQKRKLDEKNKYYNLLSEYIWNLDEVQENCYRGEAIAGKMIGKRENCLNLLKKLNIETIINYENKFKHFPTVCIKFGIEVIEFPIKTFWNSKICRTSKETLNQDDKLYIQDFKNFINAKRKGYTYEGCGSGTDRTDQALLLSKYFNPNDNQFCDIENCMDEIGNIYKVRMHNLYKNLTEQDKLDMGYTKEFDANLRRKLRIE